MFAAYSEIHADLYAHVISADIWMSQVAKEAAPEDGAAGGQIRGRANAGTTQSAISKMMGQPRARAPTAAVEVAASETEGVAAVSPRRQLGAPAAAASPVKEPGSDAAPATPGKERSTASAAASPGRKRSASAAAASPVKDHGAAAADASPGRQRRPPSATASPAKERVSQEK